MLPAGCLRVRAPVEGPAGSLVQDAYRPVRRPRFSGRREWRVGGVWRLKLRGGRIFFLLCHWPDFLADFVEIDGLAVVPAAHPRVVLLLPGIERRPLHLAFEAGGFAEFV